MKQQLLNVTPGCHLFFIVYIYHFLDFSTSIIVVDQQSTGFPDSSVGKESTCNVETWVQSLGWEDPLEKGKATHSSILV